MQIDGFINFASPSQKGAKRQVSFDSFAIYFQGFDESIYGLIGLVVEQVI